MLKSDKNPGRLSISVFDEIRARVVAERSQFSRICLQPLRMCQGHAKADRPTVVLLDVKRRNGLTAADVEDVHCDVFQGHWRGAYSGSKCQGFIDACRNSSRRAF
jgi:hypothetical protein